MFRPLLLALFLISTSAIFAQGIPNPNMEQWTGSGKPAPFDWKEPTSWKSNNAVTEFISATVTQSTTKKQGAFSCQIRTVNVFGQDVAGVVTNGAPGLDFGSYSVVSAQAGTEFIERPESIQGFYQYIAAGADQGLAVCLLKRWNSGTQTADTIGYGTATLSAAGSFVQFTVPITYSSDEYPDSIALFFYSSDPATIQNGSILRIDQLSVQLTAAVDLEVSEDAIIVFPNPSDGHIRYIFKPNVKFGQLTVQVYNILGLKLVDCPLQDFDKNPPLSPGNYYLHIRDLQRKTVQKTYILVQ
ncbi:MAG: hypothetical protein ABIV51_06895 [Saprospiraceae bacterium]